VVGCRGVNPLQCQKLLGINYSNALHRWKYHRESDLQESYVCHCIALNLRSLVRCVYLPCPSTISPLPNLQFSSPNPHFTTSVGSPSKSALGRAQRISIEFFRLGRRQSRRRLWVAVRRRNILHYSARSITVLLTYPT
jgi:hypothetical protein